MTVSLIKGIRSRGSPAISPNPDVGISTYSRNMDSTWETRDLPVLDAVVKIYEETGQAIRPRQIESVTGMEAAQVQKALRALLGEDPPFFEKGQGAMGGHILLVGKVTGHARRTIGSWPTPQGLTDRFAQAFAEAADQEHEPEKRSVLKRCAEAFGGVGKDVAAQVIAKVILQGM